MYSDCQVSYEQNVPYVFHLEETLHSLLPTLFIFCLRYVLSHCENVLMSFENSSSFSYNAEVIYYCPTHREAYLLFVSIIRAEATDSSTRHSTLLAAVMEVGDSFCSPTTSEDRPYHRWLKYSVMMPLDPPTRSRSTSSQAVLETNE